ncbi:MAG: DUF4180 domain-containing protein [Spirochaetales bacterium]|nr:DUF4180 domain-containing protein [Spirochaetales bacterium]
MEMNIMEKEGKKYIELIKGKLCIENESDAVDVVGFCGCHQTNLVLMYEDNLTEKFFDLKTGVAGEILQKFINYRVRIAIVLSMERITGRFKEMVNESHRSADFRVFSDKKAAKTWLLTHTH